MTKKNDATTRKGFTLKSMFTMVFLLTAAAAGGGCFQAPYPSSY